MQFTDELLRIFTWEESHIKLSGGLRRNDVDLVGVCDVDSNVVKKRMTDYAALRKNTPKTYSDYRELLNNKDIDAVMSFFAPDLVSFDIAIKTLRYAGASG